MQQSKQEQRIHARRNQILDAAGRVFAQKGFHPATIKDIAREAGIADGTVYIYFESKSAVLLGMFERMTEAARQTIDPATLADMDLRSFIKAYLYHPLMAVQDDNFELFRVIVSESMVNDELRVFYYQNIIEPTIVLAETRFRQWAEHHAIDPDRISVILHALSSMVLGLKLQRIMGDTTLAAHWDALPDLLADLLLDGIRSDQA